ncbi:MAG: DNA-packaging protein [Betaproteobacteria bacterium]|nr:DNA-packaging protein [Betaproteobacteria bacterium]
MLYGGSRSGKTFLLVRSLLVRAIAKKSRHAILRYRFNHLKASIIYDTLPKVMELCWPDVAKLATLDKSDWFYKLPNGSELWFGGLDEKERTEKILGQEYSTVYLNECSQIPFASRNVAMTRLAQNSGLRLKAYYDCNPPGRSHWTYKLFVEHIDPDRKTALARPEDAAWFLMNPKDNRENLPAAYFQMLESLPERQRKRFLLGEFASETESALWTPELLDHGRIVDKNPPDMQRIIIAVDPSGCSGPEDERSDEVGIVVVGLGKDQRAYIMEDLSGRHGPNEWGEIVVGAFERLSADAVIAETNFGGAMVGAIIKAVAGNKDRSVPFREVTASRGKVARAEPVSNLFQQGKVSLVGHFGELEDQLCGMTTAGYIGDRSPDRADAMVWGITELFPSLARRDPANSDPLPARANVGYSQIKPWAGQQRQSRAVTGHANAKRF